MSKVNAYLMFDGDCKDAFDFYKNAFGTDFAEISHFGDMPPQEETPPLSEETKRRVMHVTLPISAETILMGSDIMEGSQDFNRGDGFQIAIGADSRNEATELFNKLSEGGKVTTPLSGTFWGAFFGMWTDKFGVDWMVNYDDPAKVQGH